MGAAGGKRAAELGELAVVAVAVAVAVAAEPAVVAGIGFGRVGLNAA